MENKYFDFDAAMAERKGDPMIVKAFGEKYELAGELPFDIVLKVSRMKKDGQKEFSDEDMIELAAQLFGEDVFQAWLAKGISLSGVMVMVEEVMKMYMAKATSTADTMAEEKKIANP